jgi:hypothetical protein
MVEDGDNATFAFVCVYFENTRRKLRGTVDETLLIQHAGLCLRAGWFLNIDQEGLKRRS